MDNKGSNVSQSRPRPDCGGIVLARPSMAEPRGSSWLRVAGIAFLWLTLAIMAMILWRGEALIKALNASYGERILVQNPDLQQYQNELDSLQGRVAGLMKDSVENKLRMLEKSVQGGRFGPDEAGLLEALKSELQFLQNYATQGGQFKSTGEHERYRMSPEMAEDPAVARTVREWVEFEKLLYLGAGALGAGTLMLSGAWLSTRSVQYQPSRQDVFLTGHSEDNSAS
ncbi:MULTISPECIES: hypothetical protein [Methylococcus]|uniref:Uncharacterized protein n=1 Tax=Methylococcus capsulatus TaxID=414 RepID=A0ABZ2F4S9_METCP|nr:MULTISPECIES: hypothetical protein [Methylococcus]MDF9391803.1 hypothetical protein [Methylococcus capsulatus]